MLDGERVATRNDHGTGCSLAAAIAVGLAEGLDALAAVVRAKGFVADALAGAATGRSGGATGRSTTSVVGSRHLGSPRGADRAGGDDPHPDAAAAAARQHPARRRRPRRRGAHARAVRLPQHHRLAEDHHDDPAGDRRRAATRAQRDLPLLDERRAGPRTSPRRSSSRAARGCSSTVDRWGGDDFDHEDRLVVDAPRSRLLGFYRSHLVALGWSADLDGRRPRAAATSSSSKRAGRTRSTGRPASSPPRRRRRRRRSRSGCSRSPTSADARRGLEDRGDLGGRVERLDPERHLDVGALGVWCGGREEPRPHEQVDGVHDVADARRGRDAHHDDRDTAVSRQTSATSRGGRRHSHHTRNGVPDDDEADQEHAVRGGHEGGEEVAGQRARGR